MPPSGAISGSEPRIELKTSAVEATPEAGCWTVVWELTNKGSTGLEILAMRLPHGQFKSGETRFDPPLDVRPSQRTRIESLVRCREPPGEVTENAFLILAVNRSGEPWRIFCRIRVAVDPSGRPTATIESITTQKVGFSQSLSEP